MRPPVRWLAAMLKPPVPRLARLGAEGCSRATVQSGLASPRPEPCLESARRDDTGSSLTIRLGLTPTLLRNQDPSSGLAQVGTCPGWKEANSQGRLPIPLIQQKVTGDTGLTASALSVEDFSVQGWAQPSHQH